jgi:hypothetical protein
MSWWDFLTLLMATKPKPPPYPKPPRPPGEPPRPRPSIRNPFRRAWRWMRATGCLAGVGMLLVLMTGGAGAQQQRNTTNSANSMLPHCKSDTGGRGIFMEGVCSGSIATLGFVGPILDDAYRFCFPDGATNEQMTRIVIAYIEARPARMHEDFRDLALEALRAAWPCR